MIFKGHGLVWNPIKNKTIVNFNETNEYETNDLKEIEILKACSQCESIGQEEIIEPVKPKKVTKKALIAEAKIAGVKGADRMTFDELEEILKGGGTVVSSIPLGRGQTQQCVYRVPNGKTLKITNIDSYTDASSGKSASMQLVWIGSDCSTTRIKGSGTLTDSSSWSRRWDKGGVTFGPGEWALIRAFSVNANDTAITADFDGVLE